MIYRVGKEFLILKSRKKKKKIFKIFSAGSLIILLFMNIGIFADSKNDRNSLKLENLLNTANAQSEGGEKTYMQMGWCPNSLFTWGTYCISEKVYDLCNNPTC